MVYQENFYINSSGREILDITDKIARIVHKANINTGICQVFIPHTSASLMLCENYDPMVREDLENFMSRLVPDGDPEFTHTAEGPDDMPAHVRSVLTHNDLSIPITSKKLALGTWQGIYVWEHRTSAHRRKITVTISGE